MKCAYTAGILDQLLDYRTAFSFAIGVSAGSSCTASFLAGQHDRNRRFFVDHVQEAGYMGMRTFLKTGSFFGLQYIYGDLTNSDGADPIDYTAMQENPAEFEIVATNAATGHPVYFNKTDVPEDDYRIFMASCAIPVAARPVAIGKKKYFDGGCSDPIPLRRALEKGCDKLLILLCRPKTIVRGPEKHLDLVKLALTRYPKTYRAVCNRHLIYNETLSYALELEQQGKALILAPKEALPVSTYTKDPTVLQSLYDIAIRDYTREKERIERFLLR